MNRRSILPLAFLLGASVVVASACDSCACGTKEDDTPLAAKPPPKDPHGPAQMPTPGSDADQKRIEALALATKVDAELGTDKHDAKDLDPTSTGIKRKAQAWWVENGKTKMPKKLLIEEVDGQGTVTSATDFYFGDDGMVQYVKAPDGHFVFRMEGLALWLDPEQRVKRGVKPQDAGQRAALLKKDMGGALIAFAIR